MTTLNRFGRIQIADQRGYPTPPFEAWLESVLERTGGVSADISTNDLLGAAGAPVGVFAGIPSAGPVAITAQDVDAGPVAVSSNDFSGEPL